MTSTSLLASFALPGFGQAVDSDVASVNHENAHYVCTTFTDVCNADSSFEEAASGLIDALSLLPHSGETGAKRQDALLDLPPESGLEVVKTIVASDSTGVSAFVTASPAKLPDYKYPRRWEPVSAENAWHHGEPIQIEK